MPQKAGTYTYTMSMWEPPRDYSISKTPQKIKRNLLVRLIPEIKVDLTFSQEYGLNIYGSRFNTDTYSKASLLQINYRNKVLNQHIFVHKREHVSLLPTLGFMTIHLMDLKIMLSTKFYNKFSGRQKKIKTFFFFLRTMFSCLKSNSEVKQNQIKKWLIWN